MTVRQRIDDFLGQRRLAMAGVSRHPNDFSRMLFREFRARGYDMVPVHPEATEIEGIRSFKRVGEIEPPVDGVLLMTPASLTRTLVEECAAARIRRVWMYRAMGRGAVDERGVTFCEQNGIEVIPGYCPYLFFEKTALIHRLHGGLLRLIGRFPG